MKQSIDLTSINTPPTIQAVIKIWKEKKGYQNPLQLTIGEAIELLIAMSFNFHKDYSDGRFFNNILLSKESSVAWDGEQLIDILLYEVTKTIQERLSQGQFFSR